MRDSLGGPVGIRNRLSIKAFGITAVVVYILGAWLILYFWVHFQLVERQTIDYLLLLAVGLGLPFLVWLIRIGKQDPPTWSALADWSAWMGFGMIGLFTTLVGGGVIRAVNGVFDYHQPERFRAIATHVYCGRAANVELRGAPRLPTTTNTMTLELFPFGDLDCYSTQIGDTVLVDVRKGLMGRPWVAGRTPAHPRQ